MDILGSATELERVLKGPFTLEPGTDLREFGGRPYRFNKLPVGPGEEGHVVEVIHCDAFDKQAALPRGRVAYLKESLPCVQ